VPNKADFTMNKNILLACIVILFALLSSCFFNPFEQFQPAYPRNFTPPHITPIFSDENISFALV